MVPWPPVRLLMLDLWSSEAIRLHANEILESTIVSSASIIPSCSCFNNQVVKFSISNSFFFLLTSGIVSGEVATDPTAVHRIPGVTVWDCPQVVLLKRERRWWGERRETEDGELEKRMRDEPVGIVPPILFQTLSFLSLSHHLVIPPTPSYLFVCKTCVILVRLSRLLFSLHN